MAEEDKTQLLEGLYNSREVLIEKVKDISGQIRQLNAGSVLFLLFFTAIIFKEDFKISSWEKASTTLKSWKKNYGKDIKHLSLLSYQDFLQSEDSIFATTRSFLLKSIEEKVSESNPMSFYQNQLNKGFSLKDLPILKAELDTLYNTLSRFKQHNEDLNNLQSSLDSLENFYNAENEEDSLLIQKIEDITPILSEYEKQITEDSLVLTSHLDTLKSQYPKFSLLLANPKLNFQQQVDTLQTHLKTFEADEVVSAWIHIENTNPNSLKWSYGSWKLLEKNIVKDWRKTFKALNYEDSLKLSKNINTDTSFIANQSDIYNFIESQLQNDKQIPTTEFFGTQIPLPTKQILVILPVLMMTLILVFQVLNLQRKTAEMRMAKVELRIKKEVHNEELTRTNIFGEDVLDPTSVWAYLSRLKFSKIYEYSPEIYKNGFFAFANLILFGFLLNKWVLLISNDARVRFWAIGIFVAGFTFFLVLFLINRNTTKKILDKIREM